METHDQPRWIAFAGPKQIAHGPPPEVARAVKTFVGTETSHTVLVFDAKTSRPVDLDLRGSLAAVLRRVPGSEGRAATTATTDAEAARGPGRPKLGVVPREVTLLPRHWAWLGTQPGGASVALRKLVEHALRANRETDRLREAKESAYRFIHALAGDERGFEEATRALFANDLAALQRRLRSWPADVRGHALHLARSAIAPSAAEPPAPAAATAAV